MAPHPGCWQTDRFPWISFYQLEWYFRTEGDRDWKRDREHRRNNWSLVLMCAMVSTQKLDNLYLHRVNAGRMPLVIKMQWLKKKLPWQLLLVRLARAQDIYLRLYFCLHICAASHIMVFKIAEPSHRLVQTIFKVQPASTESLYKTHFSRVSIGNPIDTIANTVTYLG